MVNKYNIDDTWGIAFEHGHNAFSLLREGQKDEKKYLIYHTQSIIPQDSPRFGRGEYLDVINKQQTALKNMFRFYSGSVILFQAMMEALINDVLENKRSMIPLQDSEVKRLEKSFASKWTGVLQAVHKPTNNFKYYEDNIYKKLRIPLTHPTAKNLSNLDDLDFNNLYEGFKNGWIAYSLLYDGLGIPHDTRGESDSWTAICKIHQIKEIIKGETI